MLVATGLGALSSASSTQQHHWAQRLSLGEQQRLAFARILLRRPDCLFLDEATSALDEATEAQLYGLLRSEGWRPTVVSVGHRAALHDLHDRAVALAPAERRAGAPMAAN